VKLLIVKLHALGDLVIATPAIQRLRDGLPEARIELLTTDWAAPAVKGFEALDETIVAPHKLFFGRRPKLINLLKLAFKLRSKKYNAAVVFHISRRIDLFTVTAVGTYRFWFGEKNAERQTYLDEEKHSALTACDLADLAVTALGGRSVKPLELKDIQYHWCVLDEERRTARNLLDAEGVSGRYAVIFPGGGSNPSATNREKRWTAAGFAALAEWIAESRGLQVLVMGGSSDKDAVEAMMNLTKNAPVNLAGKTSVRILAAILSQAGLVVSNDSAPMHIACAVGAPTLGIFGPTGANAKAPIGKRSASVSLGLPCSPCYFSVFKGCIFDQIRCMTELSPDHVIPAAAALLDSDNNE